MNRKRSRSNELTPRIREVMTNAAQPVPLPKVSAILLEARIFSSEQLPPILGGSWLEALSALENLAGRTCSTAEAGALRTAIDAIRSRPTPTPKPKTVTRAHDPHMSQSDPFFMFRKHSIQEFDDANSAIRNIIRCFGEQSKFVKSARASGRDDEQIIRIISASLRASVKSPKTIILYARHTQNFYDFLIERVIPQDSWTGPCAVFPLYDFFETRAGTTVPATMKCALRTFAEALQINWPLDERAITTVCAKPDRRPKQAPMLKLEHIKRFETIAVDGTRTFGLRLYAANFALMCHASFRYDDTRTIAELVIDNEGLRGRLAHPKTSSEEAKNFRCPLQGFANNNWTDPIRQFRYSYATSRGYNPSFLFPEIDPEGKKVLETIAKKTPVLGKFRSMISETGDTDSMRFTLHSPRNWYTSVASQLGWDVRAQTTLGRWGPNSSMPNHYNRQHGTLELSVRNDVIERVLEGWNPADSKPHINHPPPAKTRHALRSDLAHLELREPAGVGY